MTPLFHQTQCGPVRQLIQADLLLIGALSIIRLAKERSRLHVLRGNYRFLAVQLMESRLQIHIRIPNIPGVSNLLMYGAQRQTSTYYCSLLCKADFLRMKVKKISRYPTPPLHSMS